MKLSVYVLGREVATLEPDGDFRSVLTYHPGVAADDLVSLTMGVRTESWVWNDEVHPFFQMNLPEGYLLEVLREQFAPHMPVRPVNLLAIIGRNMVGRVQVAAPGADLHTAPKAIELADLLQGDNSEQAFAVLVREHATSGVSGVVPKFLDAQNETVLIGNHKKATLVTRRHIIKGSSDRLPYIALNEHLCMQVASKIMATAKTEVSADGKALVVHRFDVDKNGQPALAMEDFCALLGLRPANKYDTTWERIAKAVRDHIPGERRGETFHELAKLLMLTYALRNSDCHSKNLALIYTSATDARLAPVYDMLTTVVYPGYQHNPPGMSFMGKKTWKPGKSLQNFIVGTFNVPIKQQAIILEQISDAVADTAPMLRQAMEEHPGFRETGKHMLHAWHEGVAGLRDKRSYNIPDWQPGEAFAGFSEPEKLDSGVNVIGRSELLGH